VVPSVAPEGREQIAKQLSVQEFASFDEAVEMAHRFNPRRSIENIRERLGHAMRAVSRRSLALQVRSRHGRGTQDLERLWADVRRLRCPTLLVRGAESNIVTDDGIARFLSLVPGSRVAVVAGAGHSVMGDNPAGFLAAVAPFLARHGG
jgi:pimeloyl-ACP methyl ester carboxylesterase